jgi:hypothetical protein
MHNSIRPASGPANPSGSAAEEPVPRGRGTRRLLPVALTVIIGCGLLCDVAARRPLPIVTVATRSAAGTVVHTISMARVVVARVRARGTADCYFVDVVVGRRRRKRRCCPQGR